MTTTLTTPQTTQQTAPQTGSGRTAQPTGSGRTAQPTVFPLTWLRGLAALVVVLFHAYQFNRSGPEAAWPWSGLGHRLMLGSDLFVDMFFVLSGLVL
jgi:peptidoglycan/LPS O-acetylase OafA/YrhL